MINNGGGQVKSRAIFWKNNDQQILWDGKIGIFEQKIDD